MADSLTLALAQLNPIVGDVAGNLALVRAARRDAAAQRADLVVCPELVITGYPPEDLVLKPRLHEVVAAALAVLAEDTADGGPALLVGAPVAIDGRLHNAAILLDKGQQAAVRLKADLPNYGVFDEKRVFVAGPLPGPISFRGVRLGVMVCEDMWTPDVTECLQESGAELLVAINGSPFEAGKGDERLNLAVARVVESRLPLVYVNQIGGQDELVFDGASFVLNADADLRVQLAAWRSQITATRWRRDGDGRLACIDSIVEPVAEGIEAIYCALATGLRDYVAKNRFPGVILGLSGGIDSALSAALAVDALGADAVHAVMMPSPYTARDSVEDAAAVARLLGIRLDEIAIAPAMQAFDAMLAPLFAGRAPDTTEENIQSRARGLILMALSNKLGHMVLSTGNKSEMSVGYTTLYGDMCGGFAVLKDVYKTAVFELAAWRNRQASAGARGPAGRVMPERILTKPPSAELRPGQRDQDSLPPYDKLDAILHGLIEQELGIAELVVQGHDRAIVEQVWRLLDRAEYKRRQAPPGVKISRRSFGRDRRYPITNAFVNSATAPAAG
jgi:NAD+ synthase